MKHLKTQTVTMGLAVSFLAVMPIIGLQMSEQDEPPSITESVAVSQSIALLPISSPETPARVSRTMDVIVTAYSSTPEQTDDTPFITASGNRVREGIVATNLLPLGTRIRIPELYGEKIFLVDDRMHPRKTVHVDIWFPTYWEAKTFGVERAQIEVLQD